MTSAASSFSFLVYVSIHNMQNQPWIERHYFPDRNFIWFQSNFNILCQIWKLYHVKSQYLLPYCSEVQSFAKTSNSRYYDSGVFFVCLVIFTSLSLSLLLGFAGLIIFVWLLSYTTQYLLGILKHLIGRKLILNILASVSQKKKVILYLKSIQGHTTDSVI